MTTTTPTTPTTPTTTAKPTATVTIEPLGAHSEVPREHLIKVLLNLGASDAQHADARHVTNVARRCLEAFPPPSGETDRRTFTDVSATSKARRTGAPTTTVVGVEGSVWSYGRPGVDAVGQVRETLQAGGYRVTAREKRECSEAGCAIVAVVDWDQPAVVPNGWYSNAICGRHNYRTCKGCKSLYTLTSTSSAGQAPSVPCEVCGLILISWGSSKVWRAELITRGTAPTPSL